MKPFPHRRPAQKARSVRPTRAIQRDRRKRPPRAPPAAQVEAHLTEVIHPLTLTQGAYYHDRGLRQRVLSLPVLVALVLSLIWRQIGAVRTLAPVLRHEGLLWTSPVQVSPQALSLRLRTVPADLFRRVLLALRPGALGGTHPPVAARRGLGTRPLAVLAVDGAPLDALLRVTWPSSSAPASARGHRRALITFA